MASLRLRVTHHDGVVEERTMPEGSHGIGRAEDNWLAPLDHTLSRHHAVLRVSGDEVRVEPLRTCNGTLVDGVRIDAPRRLTTGQRVLLGRTTLELTDAGARGVMDRDQPTLEVPDGPGASDMVAASSIMREVLRIASKYAASTLPVMITGESGTGKEVVARFIHSASSRRSALFFVLNCPALPAGLEESELFGVEAGVATGVTARRGRLEQAEGGTLLLDEVADLSPDAQAKLLRFLHDGTCERVGGRKGIQLDVRVIAATNQSLDPLPARFRSDLFFRLAGLRLHLPPLRERVEDIEPLVEQFLHGLGVPSLWLHPDARRALLAHSFPGNIRELKAMVGRAALLQVNGEILPEHLGLPSGGSVPVGTGPDPTTRATTLLEAIVAGRADFWETVHRPFMERTLERAVVEEVIALAVSRGDGTVRGLAATLRSPDRYRKLLDFLRNSGLLNRGTKASEESLKGSWS